MSDIKLPCKMEPWDGRVVDANDMYVDIDEVLRRVNYHARLVEALRKMTDQAYTANGHYPSDDSETFAANEDEIKQARALLAELDSMEQKL